MKFFEQIKNLPIKRVPYLILLICLLVGGALYLYFSGPSTPKMKEVYVIGRDPTWSGLELYGKEKKLHAFMNELMAQIAEKSHLQFRFVEANLNRLLENLNDHDYDAILISADDEIDSSKTYFFSDPLLETGPVLLVRQNSTVNSIESLQGKTVGVSLGMKGPLVSSLNEKLSRLQVVNYETPGRAVMALIQNQVDGIILSTLSGYSLSQGLYRDQIKVVTQPLIEQGIYVLVRDSPESEIFISTINLALLQIKKRGTYDLLIEKWDLINPEKNFQALTK